MKHLSMLENVHGDTCRLGYLKLLCCLGDDFQPYSLEYFSSRLYMLTKDCYKKWEFPHGLSNSGIITEKQGLITSKNYVNLSYDFGVLNRQHQTLGNFGRLYSKTESAKIVANFVQNAEVRSVNILHISERSSDTKDPSFQIFFHLHRTFCTSLKLQPSHKTNNPHLHRL